MPVSDLFPAAGITFWDAAHECNAGMTADGYTRATGKMSMMIAQNGPGITNFVTPVKTAYWNHSPILLVTPQAANKTMGQGGFQEIEQMKTFRRYGMLSGRSQGPQQDGRSFEPGYRKGLARMCTCPNQCSQRLLDPGNRYRIAPSGQA